MDQRQSKSNASGNRCRSENGRFESCGNSSSAKNASKSMKSGMKSGSKSSGDRCRAENGRFESCE